MINSQLTSSWKCTEIKIFGRWLGVGEGVVEMIRTAGGCLA